MPRRRRLTRAALLAFCPLPALVPAAFSRPALAQLSSEQPSAAPPSSSPLPAPPPPPSPAAPPLLEVVVTGTRTPESSQRATVRTRVVTRDEAERRGATNVGEALDGELGVQVNPSAYGALGNPSAIQIQGFDLDRVLVLEDGERVIGDAGGAIDLSSLPLGDVSRIELVTGPTSSLYGTSAIGGVVNVLSAPPEHPGFSGRARLEGRSRAGLVLHGSGAYRGERAWVSADASFQREDSLSLVEPSDNLADPGAGADAPTVLPERSQRLLGLRAGATLGKGIDVRLRARWIHDEQNGVEQKVWPVLGAYLYDLPEVTDRVTLHLAETIDLGGGSNLRLAAGRQWALRASGRDLRGSPDEEQRERSGALHSYEAIATIADGPRTWVAGARAEVETLDQVLEITKVTPSGTEETPPIEEVPDTRLGSAALYGQLAWKLTDELTLMPGVRGELRLRYGGVIAPRLALAYRPAPSLTLRVSGGRGFRAPSAKELGFSFDHSSLGYILEGNPALAPETSWGVNGDVTWIPREGLTARAGAFANWVDNLIDVNPKPLSSSAGVDTYTYMNIAEARTAGLDLSATLQATPWLRIEAGYAYLWTRDDTADPRQPLSGKPPHTAQAALRADLPFQFELVARLRTISSAFVERDPSEARDVRAPGFTTLDARLARPLWPSSQAYIGVRNLLGAQKDPDRRGDHRPLEGRTFYVGVRAELPWEDS
ncbi:TonB-dependent receptor plug domain-containing protein [Sorangium sp. So ce693]|uniref:TonB-dependent receptor plug domain-containing protein n=1 Tax=Sorangium sp. So ce693 TaxID=3133318 RepID=UPI003F5FD237